MNNNNNNNNHDTASSEIRFEYFESSESSDSKGIPVFRPTAAQFANFSHFVSAIEPVASAAGLAKIVPPIEWTRTHSPHLAGKRNPHLAAALGNVAIKSPIEQNFTHGTLPSGAYRQFNIEKGRVLSVQEWFDLCGDKTYAAPSTSTATATSTSSLQPATQQATPLKKRVRKCKVALNPQEEPVQPQIALAADQVVSESVSSINHSDADTPPPPPTCSATPISSTAAHLAALRFGADSMDDSADSMDLAPGESMESADLDKEETDEE
ncbi:hypothetical protein HDU79_007091 [Rhizoclosmatium sp. JEL0117]|nr:hypothetical protein HDU79_007091 [Rhizoclosmatium sp. JEL0117]